MGNIFIFFLCPLLTVVILVVTLRPLLKKSPAFALAMADKKPAFALATADKGGIAQLARALAWHARGRRFDSDYLHPKASQNSAGLFFLQHFEPHPSK
jgi:hypothetical protein